MNANPIKKIHNNDRILNTLANEPERERPSASGRFIDLMVVRLLGCRFDLGQGNLFVPIISQSALTPRANLAEMINN